MNEEACTTTTDTITPTDDIASAVNQEITRRKIESLIEHLKEIEDDIASLGVVHGNVDDLFNEDGKLKYFIKPFCTDNDLSKGFGLPVSEVARIIDELCPSLRYEYRVSHRLSALSTIVHRIGKAYLAKKKELDEVNKAAKEEIKHLNEKIKYLKELRTASLNEFCEWKVSLKKQENQERLILERNLFYYKLIAPIISAIMFLAGLVLRGFLQ